MTDHSRLLLLMTSNTYRAAAFLQGARSLGLQVTVGSERPQALQSLNPAGHLVLDFTRPDEACDRAIEFARDHPLAAVVAADDEGVVLAARLAAALGLRHSSEEAVCAARDKHRTRELLAAAGLNSPRFRRVSLRGRPAHGRSWGDVLDSLGRDVGFPCVVKPPSLGASRGVIRADDPEQLDQALHRVSVMLAHDGAILVESYIPGDEVAVEAILSAGELQVLALFDKPDPLEGPFFEETIYVTPSRLKPGTRVEIASTTASAVAALGLREGPIHAELRVDERGAWILEIAPRSIGGLCSRTLRFEPGQQRHAAPTRISLEELILRQALGIDVRSFRREERPAGVMMIPIPRSGILREVRGRSEAMEVAGVEDVIVTIPVGQNVVSLPEGSRYLGFIFARADTPALAEAALREAHAKLEFVITEVHDASSRGEPTSTTATAQEPTLGCG